MICSRYLWPCDGEQERAFFQCFDVVLKAALKCQEVSRIKVLHTIVRKVYSNLPQNHLHGDRPFGAVVAHITSRLHSHEDNAELCILHDGLGAPASFALPRWSVLQLFKLLTDVLSDYL